MTDDDTSGDGDAGQDASGGDSDTPTFGGEIIANDGKNANDGDSGDE